MSTILKALRRLEDEKEHQANEDRLHGEVVAPTPPPPRSRVRPMALLLAAGALSVALGAAAFVLLPGWLDDSAEQTTMDVAAATPDPVTAAPAPKRPAAGNVASKPAAAPRRAEAPPQPRTTTSPLAAAVAASEASSESARSRAPAPSPRPAPRATPRSKPAPAVAVFERSRPPSSESAAPPTETAPKRLAQATRSIDDLPQHETTPPPPKPRSVPKPEPTTRVAEPKARPAPETAKPEALAPKAAPAPKTVERKPQAATNSDLEHIPRERVPDVEVVSTVWHPDPTRRVARLEVNGGELIEFHEGDTIAGGLVVTEIKLSGVTLKHDDVTISKRVGKGR